MMINDLIRLFRAIITTGLQDRGYAAMPVIQAYQPTEEGVSNDPTIYYNLVSNYRYGFTGVSVYPNNPDPDEMQLNQTQYYETTFQIGALVFTPVFSTTEPTALDVVTTVAEILTSEKSLHTLSQAGVGILRPIEIRTPYFKDDKQQFEMYPNFDFVLTYKNVNISNIPIIKRVDAEFYRI